MNLYTSLDEADYDALLPGDGKATEQFGTGTDRGGVGVQSRRISRELLVVPPSQTRRESTVLPPPGVHGHSRSLPFLKPMGGDASPVKGDVPSPPPYGELSEVVADVLGRCDRL